MTSEPSTPQSTPPAPSAASSVLELFRRTGAYLTGHFRLTSGLHSPNYLQSAIVLQFPQHAQTLGRDLASRVLALTAGAHEPGTPAPAGPETPAQPNDAATPCASAAQHKVDLVVSPALGGLVIGHEVARALGVRFVFTERDADRRMSLRRGFSIQPGERAVVIEDVITTGGSTREVIDIVRACGAIPVAAGSIVDRSGGRADLGIPRAALETLTVSVWDPAVCPLCAAGEPVVKPGSRPV